VQAVSRFHLREGAIGSEKFEEFQTTLTKSNEVFATFKKDMDTVSLQ